MMCFPFEVHGADARIALIQDETARHQAEEALRASEERYRTAMTLGRMGSWEVDFVKATRTWTPEGRALFGINLNDGLGHVGGETDELRQSIHPEDRHLLAQYHALANTQLRLAVVGEI